jgi:hypothetical protein
MSNKAQYRKINDRQMNSSTYHKKDGTAVRAKLKVELKKIKEDEAMDDVKTLGKIVGDGLYEGAYECHCPNCNVTLVTGGLYTICWSCEQNITITLP